MAPKTMVSNEIYLLPLKDDGSPDVPGGYIYLTPKTSAPITIRFEIEGTSSICRHGSLWVNIPEEGEEYQREKFREFRLEPDFNRTIEISIPIHGAGAFAFYTTYAPLPDLSETLSKAVTPTRTETYYIDVAPRLTLEGRQMPLAALSIFSLISKFMGKYPSDWEKHLRGISERGYNMVHFTPLQQRGASNSPYSIYDQLAWDPECFPNGEADIKSLINSMENKHGLLGLTDVVWNHTAHNSQWIQEHPEVGYNVSTAPHLRSALELDTALLEFSSKLAENDLPTNLTSVDELLKIMDGVKEMVIAKLQLWEYYVLDIERDADATVEAWANGDITFPEGGFGGSDFGGLETIKNSTPAQQAQFLLKCGILNKKQLGMRYHRRVNPSVAAALLTAIYGRFEGDDSDSADRGAARSQLVKILDEVNLPLYQEYDKDIAEILQQVFNRVKYVRLDDHGPKLGPINEKNPLIETYFTRLPKNSITSKHNQEDLALANNGWIWAANALVDNAGPLSKAYLRREVIVWGDCVKLRYGSRREDSPFLWDFMAKYTRLMAKYFTGFRIDNCHSTPIHVAEFLLDEARRVRPNLFICAELFTGSEKMDYIFVERLGISCLIREAMQAWGTGELSRLVHRHGGRPIGSFEVDELAGADKNIPNSQINGQGNGEPKREIIRKIKQTPVQALFMDCTHDNEVPAQKRDARDTLPNAALVSMCASATGSVMGYDEIYPKLVDLVHETRLYDSPYSSKHVEVGSGEGGIGGIKKLLNQIHELMGKDGYDETHIHHEDQYITVHRVHPESRKGYFLIAHTAFPGYGNGNGGFNPVHLTGTKARHLGSWMLEVDVSEEAKKEVLADKKKLRGLPSKVIDLPGVRMETKQDETVITVRDKFPPGSIALFETWIPSAEHASGLDTYVSSGAKEAFSNLDLIDLNFVLYRCEAEELDSSDGKDGVYDIPGHGKLVYAGLQGWWSVLKNIIRENNLAHPLCQHLRNGQWPLDYIVGRLERISKKARYERLSKPGAWLKDRFDAIRKIPSFLLPRYFGLVLRTAYQAAWNRGLNLMNENVQKGQWFLKSLAMVSVQQTGLVKSASLYPKKAVPSLAAGLPHFAVEWARCWGRDVFIAARGLFLGTGRYAECREHILAFSSVLKHGMIPNLLSSGNAPRYNSRDSIWFMLQTIQDYTKIVPNGLELLKETIPRRFLPYDDTYFDSNDPRAYSKTSTLEDIIQEALQRHASGMSYREANAGPNLDMQMSSEGFQQDIKVDWANGIIFGGNQANCGTWMDKMGESERAHSKGVPGTPRDGAAIEITGLHYSTLVWLAQLHQEGNYKYAGVSTSDANRKVITFSDWANLIKDNFERCYYVPLQSKDDKDYDVNPKIINRRGIYKDLYKSGKEYEDYQLRANFPIAMTVAPDLFDNTHALHALSVADKVLRGPTGMATLDPADLNYHPYYNNSEDSDAFATSKGRNYHQGPEWLWPTGFFLRALLKFDLKRRQGPEQKTEAFQQITRRLKGCKEAIISSDWAGLTELTNKNGEYCGDSSPTQAWSAGCLIDLYHDAAQYDVSQLSASN
ncbi:putative glycogen debranching enzyme [Tricladium varicosporioides]|nr:putative glycogen debranching enzyme [Hymenoscyphus varicosporioides]